MASCRHASDIELCDECNQGSRWCATCMARSAKARCVVCGTVTEAA